MAGWGTLFGKIAEYFQSPAQRRRNHIDKLEKRQKEISNNQRNDLVAEYDRNNIELKQLYEEAKNAGA